MAQIVFCDANVLYPSLFRNLLVRLGQHGLCRLRWSDTVHEEWIRNVHKNLNLDVRALQRTRRMMENALPDAAVTDYAHRIPALTLPDPDDRHVLAAAIQAGADAILTFNLRDFPREVVQAHGLDVLHSDPWLCGVLDTYPAEAGAVLAELLAALKNPPLSRAEFCASLERLGLPGGAARVRIGWGE